MKMLIAYASAHGSTGEVAHFMARLLRAYSLDVTVANVNDISSVDEYKVVIMGSAVHAGMWLPSLSQFLTRFEKELKLTQNHLFLSCIRVLEQGGLGHVLEDYLYEPALANIGISTNRVGVFAGKLQQDDIDGNERWLLATQYDGKTMPGRYDQDFRNWHTIAAWACNIAEELEATPNFADDEIVMGK